MSEPRHRLDAVLEALEAEGYGTVEVEGNRYVDASPRFCALIGYSRDELLSLPDVGATLTPGERTRALADLVAVGEAAVDVSGTATFLHRDGTPIVASASARSIPTGDGRTRTLAIVRDITSEVRRRDQLAAYAEVLQRMSMGLILWRVDHPDARSDVRIVAVNRAATAGSGRRPSELVGLRALDVYPGPVGQARAEAILEAHRTRRLLDLGEAVEAEGGFFPPGTHRHALVPLPGDLVASLIENVSTRREADRHRRELLQRILEAAGEERRRVAVGLHDDVIQTLAAALLEIDAARGGPDGAAAAASDRIEQNLRSVIERLRALVFELLPPELEEGLAAGVEVAAGKTFAGSGTAVACRFDLAVEPDRDTADMAYRIVAEALMNARRHADAATVTVELRSDERWLTGSVTDDGRGAAELVTPPGHLGLRTMRERAELLDGSCAVRSVPGQGTVVEFRLPARATGAAGVDR